MGHRDNKDGAFLFIKEYHRFVNCKPWSLTEWASESTCLTMFRSISWTIAFSQKPNNNNNVCRAQSNHDGQLILFKTIVYIYYRTTISSCPLKTNSELSFSSISLSVLYLFHFYLVSQIPRVVPIHCVKLKKINPLVIFYVDMGRLDTAYLCKSKI